MAKVLFVFLLCFVQLGFAKNILGIASKAPLKPESERLSGMLDRKFDEGLLPINVGRQKWWISVAYKKPQRSAPLFFLLPGATQEKTSYAAVISDLLDLQPNAGILAIDLYGQGESLMASLPLHQDIPLNSNGEVVNKIYKLYRQKNANGKVVIAGISYGAGVALSASFQSPELLDDMGRGITRMVAMSFGEEANIVTNQINLQAGILKLFWPNPETSIKPFRDSFTRMSVFSQSALAEPIVLKRPFPWTLEANFRILAGLGQMDFDGFGRVLPKKSLDVLLSFEDDYLDLKAISRRYKKWPGLRTMMLMTDADHKINRSNPRFLAHWLLELSKKPRHGTYYGVPIEGKVYHAKNCDLSRQYPREEGRSTEDIWQGNLAEAYRSWFTGYDNPFLSWWQISAFYWWQQYFWVTNQWISLWTGEFNLAEFTFAKMDDVRFILDQWGKLQLGYIKQITANSPDYERDGSGQFLCQPE